MAKFNNHNGFSLMELILALAIGSGLFLIIISTYDFNQKSYIIINNNAEIAQNGRVILDRISRELRQTDEIVTDLPLTNQSPDIPSPEIVFQDGHDNSDISYIKYFLATSTVYRQKIVFTFSSDPLTHVYWNATDQVQQPPDATISDTKVIGEYVDLLEFWGDKNININLKLNKDNKTTIFNTEIYGRNL